MGMKNLICALSLALFSAINYPVFAEHEETTIIGTVVDMNWVTRSLTMRYFDAKTSGIDEITLFVPRDAKLTRGSSTMFVSDIKQSDKIRVTYYDDGEAGLKVKALSNMNRGNT